MIYYVFLGKTNKNVSAKRYISINAQCANILIHIKVRQGVCHKTKEFSIKELHINSLELLS